MHRIAGVLIFAISAGAVEPGKPSLTALTVAAQRAIGAHCPDPLLRNPDFLAEKFLGPDVRAELAKRSPRMSRALGMGYDDAVRSITARENVFYALLARTKHIDAELKKCLANGAEQVVIWATGLAPGCLEYLFADGGLRRGHWQMLAPGSDQRLLEPAGLRLAAARSRSNAAAWDPRSRSRRSRATPDWWARRAGRNGRRPRARVG